MDDKKLFLNDLNEASGKIHRMYHSVWFRPDKYETLNAMRIYERLVIMHKEIEDLEKHFLHNIH